MFGNWIGGLIITGNLEASVERAKIFVCIYGLDWIWMAGWKGGIREGVHQKQNPALTKGCMCVCVICVGLYVEKELCCKRFDA